MSAIDLFAVLTACGQSDTAMIEPFLYLDGQGAEHYDVAVTVACFREARRRLMPDTSGAGKGAQVISDTTVYLPTGTVVPVHSRVTLTDGAGAREVMQVLDHNGSGMPTPDHLEVILV